MITTTHGEPMDIKPDKSGPMSTKEFRACTSVVERAISALEERLQEISGDEKCFFSWGNCTIELRNGVLHITEDGFTRRLIDSCPELLLAFLVQDDDGALNFFQYALYCAEGSREDRRLWKIQSQAQSFLERFEGANEKTAD